MTTNPRFLGYWSFDGYHGGTLDEDDQGFPFVVCACGWCSAPAPDNETAMDMFGDHREERGQAKVGRDFDHEDLTVLRAVAGDREDGHADHLRSIADRLESVCSRA